MEQARCAVEVTAGLIPGQAMPEFTKQFWTTSKEWQEAEDHRGLLDEKMREAREYADTLYDPRKVNWVRVDWVYF